MHSRIRQQAGFFRIFLIGIISIFLCIIAARAVIIAPHDFPTPITFTITRGESLGAVAEHLASEHLIRSAQAFKIFMLILGDERTITEGQFYFDRPVSALGVAIRISGKDFGIVQYKVTFPEGYTNNEIAVRLKEIFPEFDTGLFLSLAKNEQGYLFPDTYSFSPNVTPDTVIAALKGNYEQKIKSLADDFLASGRTEKEIITMASIVEKEATGAEESAVVAGILWKRIAKGIPLQVDAPFLFLFNKKSSELTLNDLAVDSPYNTYKHRGLTPTPISNPGLIAITAALHPIESPYLYYLHDDKGNIHYARTFEEHKLNKQKYLR